MTNISLEKCPWCDGSGSTTQDGYIFSTHYPCPDCEGTGFKYGRVAEKEWERQVEERWAKADKLIDEYEKRIKNKGEC
jgi:RecJ-like exonuclease